VGARTKARKRALDVLYEAEQRGVDALTLLRQRRPVAQPPLPEYAVTLVEGVHAHRERIDELLSQYSQGWTVQRMPSVDRSLLRIGLFELLWRDDVPDAVAVSEAVELAKSLSTDQSPSFVNGLLGRLLQMKSSLVQ
jgi:transcription antitermination protein NusB